MWQPKPLVVGHLTVTKRAYEQDPDMVRRAVEFATATVHNGLGPAGLRDLSDMLLPIPGRSAARGEVAHKKFADMNRKERRAFNSSKSR